MGNFAIFIINTFNFNMNKEEFKKYVLAEARKHIFSLDSNSTESQDTFLNESENPAISSQKEEINPSDIKRLAEEIKKINKEIDLRNPLLSDSGESLVESIMKNNAQPLKDRELDVDSINKQKNITFKNESEKDKWNRMINHSKFNEEGEK